MEELEQKPQDSATFNSGLEYTKTLITFERRIAEALFSATAGANPKEFESANELIDLLWIELVEWIDKLKGETEKQIDIREKQRAAAQRIKEAVSNKSNKINTDDIELFKMRIVMLKRVINVSGLRMPKIDDNSGTPTLMRPARSNFRRF